MIHDRTAERRVPSPYANTPYDLLATPELGPLPVSSSRREVDERFAALARGGAPSREQREAWSSLRVPDRRLIIDIFQSSARQQLQALASLAEVPPTIGPTTAPSAAAAHALLPGPELVVWDSLPDAVDRGRFGERPLTLGPLASGSGAASFDLAACVGAVLDS